MPSEKSGVNKKESTTGSIVSQAALAPVAPSLSTPPTSPPSANANERAGLSQSHSLINSRNVVITDGQFHQTHGHHNSLVIHVSQGSAADSQSSSPPLSDIRHISPAQSSGQSSHSENRTRIEVDHERNQPQVSSQSQEISFQKSNDIYERHLMLKGRGFPLWIPDPNRVLHLDYRRTGVRIGDVGIITESGAFSFLFNICLPHNDPVNPEMLPEHFAPISPPIAATDIENFKVFKNGDHLASASVRRSQTGNAISDIVFESSASEGAILTMPRGARSEKLGNLARFREYEAANIANWYRFVNGPRGREAKNGDVRLVVGFDKTTSWGIATFANQTQQNSSRFKFGPSDGDSASTYTWSECSGVADVRAGPDSDEIDELRIDGDPPDVQFENQCLFVRTLNVTLADDVWADIHSSSDSNPVDPRNSQYPRVRNYSDSNRPHSNNPDNGSNFSPSQGAQSGTQRRLQGVDITSDKNPPIFVSGPIESFTTHPSKVLNDTLLAKNPKAKMVITHDDDWSSVTEYDTLLDPHEFVGNILASRDIYQENGVVFLEPKKIINETSESSSSVNRAQALSEPDQEPVDEGLNKRLADFNLASRKSLNVEMSDSMNTGIANSFRFHRQPQIPTQVPPLLSFSSDRQISPKLTDQMDSSNPSASNLSPYNNDVQRVSHSNQFPPFKPTSTSSFNFPLSSSGGKRSETLNSKQRLSRLVLELASQPGNNICADCKARLPRWASYNLGIFICVNCASIHRKIGTHITKIKSLTMDDWTKEQVETMRSIGNINSNKIYNPDEIRNPPPLNQEESKRNDNEIEQYIRAKYEYRKFFDKYRVPVKPPQMLPTAQPPQHFGVLWDDINSLNNSRNSSLPLQYQQPAYGNYSMQLPAGNSAIAPASYRSILNPYQPDQLEVRMNPFPQQQSRPYFAPSSLTSTFSTMPTMSSQRLGQQFFNSQSSTSLVPVTSTYHNPQPQTSMQIQGQSFISESLSPSTQPTLAGQSQLTLQQQQMQQQQQQLVNATTDDVTPRPSAHTQTLDYAQGGFPPQSGGGQWGNTM